MYGQKHAVCGCRGSPDDNLVCCVDYTDKKQYNKFIRDTYNICYAHTPLAWECQLNICFFDITGVMTREIVINV